MISLEPPRGRAGGSAPGAIPDPWRDAGLSWSGLSRFLHRAQAAVGLHGEVDVLLTGDSALRRLNRDFRGKNKATDVLSFPASPELAGVHAGDLAVSLQTAARQAAEHGHTLRDEVRVLLLHGLLHLHGLDHETDQGEMAARETELRRLLRLPTGLIARSTATAPGGTSRPKMASRISSARPSPSGRTVARTGAPPTAVPRTTPARKAARR